MTHISPATVPAASQRPQSDQLKAAGHSFRLINHVGVGEGVNSLFKPNIVSMHPADNRDLDCDR